MRFPVFPVGYTLTDLQVGTNLEGPTVIPADYQSGMMVVANDDVTRPLYVGHMTCLQTATDRRYELWVGSTPYWSLPGNWPRFNRPIAPGATDQYAVSVRFGPTGSTTTQLAPDIYASDGARYPFQLKWADRRPIGNIHLANSDVAGSLYNPRGYFGGTFDIKTLRGRETFRKLLMRSADQSIQVLLNTNAQGMIVWDLEGEQYRRINYVGDPTMLDTLAPEMFYKGAVDAYFQKFRDAGLRVGVTIRAQKLAWDGTRWTQKEAKDPYSILWHKINYARKRWGATLFYVDTNANPKGRLYDAQIFKRLADAFHNVLLIPEHQNTRYYAYTAPYQDVLLGEMGTPLSARQAYPGAFSAINATLGDSTAGGRDELLASVRRGDILIFRGWFASTDSVFVKGIYDEAFPPAP